MQLLKDYRRKSMKQAPSAKPQLTVGLSVMLKKPVALKTTKPAAASKQAIAQAMVRLKATFATMSELLFNTKKNMVFLKLRLKPMCARQTNALH